ncbi:SRPBCC family protein [Antrihabitans stalactiti]|uniref:SRPBCC family protein n=1 Tax=Antrihabitans stalactiti TaxID=2584121 RepID=A0A848KDB2_9NOCA|nr:SRPBCC family protein [Antrihabitans stalactiti]NMN95726.1 SRPBCC family protein [Antrihabitans stalactiti]
MTTRNYRPGPLQRVELTADGTRWALTFQREFPQSPESVWSALTAPDEHARWSPYIADRNLASTGPALLIMNDGGNHVELDGTVTIADAPKLLEHAWATDVLRWQLDPTDSGGTRLTLTHTTDDKDSSAMLAAGWHIGLDVAALALDGTPIGRIVGTDALDYGWRELNVAYSEQLGVAVAEPPV